MGLETVVEEIRSKGKSEVEKIRAESKKDVDHILAEANKRVAEIKLSVEEDVAKQNAHFMSIEVSAANLLVKRELLNTKKEMLNQVYQTALAEISNLPESFHKETIKKLLTDAKKEIHEGIIHCNAKSVPLAKAVLLEHRDFTGFSLGTPIDIEGGIIIEDTGGSMQIDYSYRTFLDRVWESGLKDASDILFA
ncbi:MAG: V-type ATP synthase subunit E family protein [Methanoregulaceae archaeon]|jgi:V/A-type H+-transporting ATPase subunit E